MLEGIVGMQRYKPALTSKPPHATVLTLLYKDGQYESSLNVSIDVIMLHPHIRKQHHIRCKQQTR